MIGSGYMYAAPSQDLGGLEPFKPFVPAQPWTPDRCREFIDKLMGADEFDIMRALDLVDDAARQRVFDWLKARIESAGRDSAGR
ncbi:MAG TPA: hypothetical protein DEB56_14595 [Thiobacillus sp.]|nr:hypothetical protein [Thiobacillus sp.]